MWYTGIYGVKDKDHGRIFIINDIAMTTFNMGHIMAQVAVLQMNIEMRHVIAIKLGGIRHSHIQGQFWGFSTFIFSLQIPPNPSII